MTMRIKITLTLLTLSFVSIIFMPKIMKSATNQFANQINQEFGIRENEKKEKLEFKNLKIFKNNKSEKIM